MADTKLVGDGTADKFICTLFVESASVRVRVQKIDFTACVLNWGYTAALGNNVNFAPSTGGETVLYDASFTADKGRTIYYNITADTTEQFSAPRTLLIPKQETYFRILVLSDTHLGGGSEASPTNINGNYDGDGTHDLLGAMQANFSPIIPAITALNPDFVLLNGDEIEGQYGNEGQNAQLLTTIQAIKKPVFAVKGNHEGDNGVYRPEVAPNEDGSLSAAQIEANAYALADRVKYLMHPSNGAAARYGYVDLGPARLIFLDPLSYSTQRVYFQDTNPKKVTTLGSEQLAFLRSALEGNQKVNIIFMHHFLTGKPQHSYNNPVPPENAISYCWGGLMLNESPSAFSQDDELFPLLNRHNIVAFQGHSHCGYAREKCPVKNGSYVYTIAGAGGIPQPASGPPNYNTTEYFGFSQLGPKNYKSYADVAGGGYLYYLDISQSQIIVTLCDMNGNTITGGGLINPTKIIYRHDENAGHIG